MKQLVVAMALMALAVSSAAQEPGKRSEVSVSSDAKASVDRMSAYLRSLQTFEIQVQSSRDEVLPFGYKLQNNETARVLVQLPDKFRVDVDGDIKTRSYYYDGKTLTIVAPEQDVYAQAPAPGTIREVVDGLLNAGVELPLIDVLRQASGGSLLEGVRYGLVVDNAPLEGEKVDHLAFRQPTVDWQLWVSDKGQPRKILITTRYAVGDPQYQATMQWNARPRIDRNAFVFRPSKGMRQITFDNLRPVVDRRIGVAP